MSGYSWIFVVPSSEDLPFHFCNPAKVVFSVIFKVINSGGKCYMGYVQFLFKHDAATLKAKYPSYEWFESINDPAVYSAYLSAPCSREPAVVFGAPRPKRQHFRFNPISAAKKQMKDFLRRELRQAALDLLKPQ